MASGKKAKRKKWVMPVVNNPRQKKGGKIAEKKIAKVAEAKVKRAPAKVPQKKNAAKKAVKAGKKKTMKAAKKKIGAVGKKPERKIAAAERKAAKTQGLGSEREIEQEAKDILEEAKETHGPKKEGGGAPRGSEDEVQEAFASGEEEKESEDERAGREIEEGFGKKSEGEAKEEQVKLQEFVKEEDENRFHLDISTETEKGEPESNLEAVVAKRRSRSLPENIQESRVIEAALFMSSKPLGTQELSKLTGIAALGYVENEVKRLQEEYAQKGSAIVIANEEGKYIMRLRPEYLQFVKDFAQEGELSRTALKVLAYIAKSEGILKSTLVKRIGTTVYEGVGELVGKGFVEQRRSGRSSSLRTTQKFREYFSQ